MSGAPGRFGAVITAMATPFCEDGALDLDGAVELARWLCAHGSDGLVVAGSTGEATSLSDAEKLDLWRAVSSGVTAPVIAGTGTADTGHSVELTRSAADTGAAAVLVVTPYYSRPSQAGLAAHFRAVAAATSLPVVLYDIPSRTGRRLAGSTVRSLVSDVSNIVAIKDAAGDVAGSSRLLAETPERFELYSGDDHLTLPLLSVGASGVVSVASHWAGEELAELVSAYSTGDNYRARHINSLLIPSFDFESTEEAPNPMPAKAMLRVMGLPGGQCRPPLGPAPASLDHGARNLLAQLRRSMRESRPASEARSPAGRGAPEAPAAQEAPVYVSGAEPGQAGG
jgi:4-hydroxy-tetrahydrodipicolinate synthase